MRKRLMMTTAMLLLSLFTSVALWAYDTSGTVGDNITWKLDDQGTLTFTGSGEIPDYDANDNHSPWSEMNVYKLVLDPNITRIGDYAFFLCFDIKSIDFGNSEGQETKLEDIGEYAFANCYGLSGDLAIPSGVKTIGHFAYYNCKGIKNLTLPASLTAPDKQAFYECYLKSVTMLATTPPAYELEVLSSTDNIFIPTESMKDYPKAEYWSGLKDKLRIKDKRVYATVTKGFGDLTMTLYYDNKVGAYGDDDLSVYEFGDTFDGEKLRTMGGRTSRINKAYFDESIADYHPTTCENWFYNFYGLQTIYNLDRVDTKDVKSMRGMFYSCGKLWAPDFSTFNTANVENMELMFYGCSGIVSLDLKAFDTSKVTSMQGMFQGCSKMKSLDISTFNTSGVTTMQEMFQGCSRIGGLDLSSFDTSNVTTMQGMFQDCSGIGSLDLSSFDTSNVTSMQGMFKGCSSIETLDLSLFDTRNLVDMAEMFNEASTLKVIYVSNENFVTDKVSSTGNVFENCNNLRYPTGTKACANYNTSGNFQMKVGTINGQPFGVWGDYPTLDELTLDDSKELVIMNAVAVKKSSYTRTMKSRWGTLCLPFYFHSDNDAYDMYYIESIADDEITLKKWEYLVMAGWPMIFYRKTDNNTIVFNGDENCNMATLYPGFGNEDGKRLTGTYTTTTLDDTDYFIAGDAFRRVGDYKTGTAKGVKVAPYHAYIKGAQTSAQTASVLRLMGGETTGIGNALVDDLNNAAAEYYTPDGRRTDGLQKGLNIVKVGGKTRKVIVR